MKNSLCGDSTRNRLLRRFVLYAGLALLIAGCATGTAILESYFTPASISDTLDSFESASLAIKASNRILRTPMQENDVWPVKLWEAPKGENIAAMGISMLGASQGITIPTEFDPQTGFPRPTSALYILMKDRMAMMDKFCLRQHETYFKKHREVISYNPYEGKIVEGNPYVYKSTLWAYGTVMNNKEDIKKAESDIELYNKGFEKCDAWIRHSEKGQVQEAACKASVNSDEVKKNLEEKSKLTKEDLERDRKQYDKLSGRVYKASLAGADFTAAAVAKLVGAIIKAPQALENANNEFKGWKGAVNTAMILPRIKNAISSLGTYKDNLGLQVTTYTTMASNLKDKYKLKDDEKTKAAWNRLRDMEAALKEIEPKLALIEKGGDIAFTAAEIRTWELRAAAYSDYDFKTIRTPGNLVAAAFGERTGGVK